MSLRNLPTVQSNACKSGTLASTANTANQVIATYTVTAGKTLFLQYLCANVRLTTFAATATNFGTVSLLVNDVATLTWTVVAGPGVLNSPLYMELPLTIPFQVGTVLKVVCTPSAATAFTWDASLCGIEQ